MFFKEWPANIFIKRISEIVIHTFESFLKYIWRRRILKPEQKEITEPLQGILIHGIDNRKIQNAEIQ